MLALYRPKLLLLSPLFFMIQKIPSAVWSHGFKSSKYPEIWFVSHFQRKNPIKILLINYSWAHYDVNTSWEIPTACGNVSKNQPLQIYEWNKSFPLCVISCLRFQIRNNSLNIHDLFTTGWCQLFFETYFLYLRAVIAIENQRNLYRGLQAGQCMPREIPRAF